MSHNESPVRAAMTGDKINESVDASPTRQRRFLFDKFSIFFNFDRTVVPT